MTKKRSSKQLSTTKETPSSHAEPAKICSRSATTLKRRSGDDNLRCAAPFVRKILTHISASACTPYNPDDERSEEHTSELQSRGHLVCRLLLEKKNKRTDHAYIS